MPRAKADSKVFEKQCHRCGEIKPLGSFHKHKKARFGRAETCKECHKPAARAAFRALQKPGRPPKGYRRCSRCRKVLPVQCFSAAKGDTYCKPCRRKVYYENSEQQKTARREREQQLRNEDWATFKFLRLRGRSRESRTKKTPATEFALVLSDFKEWVERQRPFRCMYCLLTEPELQALRIALSIDRLDNDKGYLPDNIGIACLLCNKVKRDFLTAEDMLVIGPVIRARLLVLSHRTGNTLHNISPPQEADVSRPQAA